MEALIMMNSKELRTFKRGVVDGFLSFPRAMRSIAISLRESRTGKQEEIDIESILKTSQSQSISDDFFQVGGDMRKVMKTYDDQYRRNNRSK